jgi:hypothetical protein
VAVFGKTDIEGRRFVSAGLLLDWLRDGTTDVPVFVKDTTDRRHPAILADRRFLAEAQHSFLIRHPDEIVPSYYALRPEMAVDEIGLDTLYELFMAVCDTGNRPVVIDSDDLRTRPAETIAAYCTAVGFSFIPGALTWEPGQRSEWRSFARWHADVAASSGFEQRRRTYKVTTDNSEFLARCAAHHLPFYQRLHAHRLVVGRR